MYKPSIFRRGLLAAALLSCASAQAAFVLSDFTGGGGLQLNGSAVAAPGLIRLTRARTFQAGSAFTQSLVTANAFSTLFRFRMSARGGTLSDCQQGVGGDGITFVLQGQGPTALGGHGADIGYGGIPNSLGVEFDTFCNEDVADRDDVTSNHVAIVAGGSNDHLFLPYAPVPVAPDFDNGAIWNAWIDYDGTTVEVRLSPNSLRPATPVLSQAVDVVANVGAALAYAGFTSGTGEDYAHHDLLYWAYENRYAPIKSIAGSIQGLERYQLVCTNLSSGQRVARNNLTAPVFDCSALGLTVNDGDQTRVQLTGPAD